MGEAVAALGIGKGIIAVATLKPGIAGLFSIGNAAKEAIKAPLEAQEHILDDLGVNILVFRTQYRFNLDQIALLLVVGDGLASHTIGFFAFRKGCIVKFPAPWQCPEEHLLLLLRGGEPKLIGFSHRFFCPST